MASLLSNLQLSLFLIICSVNSINVLSRSGLLEYKRSNKEVGKKLDPGLVVQGYVFCQYSEHTLPESSPLAGVTVRVECDIVKESRVIAQDVKTNQNGNFTILLPKEYADFCKVYIISSPVENCSSPTNLNGGINGTHLNTTAGDIIGPFAFEPKKAADNKVPIIAAASTVVAHITDFPFCDIICDFNCGCCACTYNDNNECQCSS